MATARRTLVLDAGNTTLFAGWFVGRKLRHQLRVPIETAASRQGFAEHVAARLPATADTAVMCSVVPRQNARLLTNVRRTFAIEPRLLTAASPHGLRIGYRRPAELGTDRLACALGARALFPGRHAIVVDFGTATT